MLNSVLPRSGNSCFTVSAMLPCSIMLQNNWTITTDAAQDLDLMPRVAPGMEEGRSDCLLNTWSTHIPIQSGSYFHKMPLLLFPTVPLNPPFQFPFLSNGPKTTCVRDSCCVNRHHCKNPCPSNLTPPPLPKCRKGQKQHSRDKPAAQWLLHIPSELSLLE